MTLLLKDILSRLEGLEIYSLSNDEIILVPLEEMDSPDLYQMVKDAVDDTEFAGMVRVSLFYLKKLPVTDGWRRDIFCDGVISYDFKKMNADYYHQAVKHFRGELITEDDLVLYHDGKLARLFCPVF